MIMFVVVVVVVVIGTIINVIFRRRLYSRARTIRGFALSDLLSNKSDDCSILHAKQRGLLG